MSSGFDPQHGGSSVPVRNVSIIYVINLWKSWDIFVCVGVCFCVCVHPFVTFCVYVLVNAIICENVCVILYRLVVCFLL